MMGNQERQLFTLRDPSSTPYLHYLPLLFRLCRSSFFIKRHRLWWIVIFNFHIHKFQGSSPQEKITHGYQFMILKRLYLDLLRCQTRGISVSTVEHLLLNYFLISLFIGLNHCFVYLSTWIFVSFFKLKIFLNSFSNVAEIKIL